MTERNEAINIIRQALKARSGKVWSVTGGRGTAWGWIRIDAPPSERGYDLDGVDHQWQRAGYMSLKRRAELAQLLGLTHPEPYVSIAAHSTHRAEYVARAKGETPTLSDRRTGIEEVER